MAIEFFKREEIDHGIRVWYDGIDGDRVVQTTIHNTGLMLVTFAPRYFSWTFQGQRYQSFSDIKMTYEVLPQPTQKEEQ